MYFLLTRSFKYTHTYIQKKQSNKQKKNNIDKNEAETLGISFYFDM